MTPLTLKISLENGTIFKKVKFNAKDQIYEALKIMEEKVFNGSGGEGFGLFLKSAEDQNSGIWLEPEKTLEYYMLREGDIVHYMNRIRTLRLRLLDGSVKTMKVDDSLAVNFLMVQICSKIGITNHDEYALCREVKQEEIPDDAKSLSSTDTSTLKRKTPQGQVMTTLERDAKMEQLRKKLKTDDEVQWVDFTKTLREQSIEPSETLLLKRRLFFSDRNVDTRDPIQLNLLYVQARDAILDGTHPVTQEQAIQFAGIQCQIQFGDHNEAKHIAAFIDSSLKDFLPEHYIRVRGIEKSIAKEHKKHKELSELDAKLNYIKTARSLTTYGVTFFLVKEKQKGKNKLVPRLLGINAESILRVDEKTRDILEIWPLTHVKKWAPTTTTFTLDFGEYSKQLYTVQTTEAPRIIEVLSAYIDIIMKKKRGKDYYEMELDGDGQILQENVVPNNANVIKHIIMEGQPKMVTTEHFTGAYQILPDVGETNNIVKAQQNITTQIAHASSRGIIRSAALSSERQPEIIKELKLRNRTVPNLLNSINVASQKLSTICEEKENPDVEELQDEMDCINNYMTDLKQGIESKTERMDDKAKKIIMNQFDIICASSNQLATLVNAKQPLNISELQAEAAKLSDASTKLYFLMDPETKRRSQLLLASRKSFLEEEEETDKRMSKVLNQGISDICDSMNAAEQSLDKDDNQPIMSQQHLQKIKHRAANTLAQINAAAAVLLGAYVDRENIDFPAAVISVNTISELVPNVIGDVKLLSRIMPENKREIVLNNLFNHCENVKGLCSSLKTQNIDNIDKAAQKFAVESRGLFASIDVNIDPNLMQEIIRLAKIVGDKTSDLLLAANKALTTVDADTSNSIGRASDMLTHSSKRLTTCAELTAPSIFERHCNSAMLTALQGVRNSTQALENSWKPVVDASIHQDLASDLAYHTAEVENAVDDLNALCKSTSAKFVFNIRDCAEEAIEVNGQTKTGAHVKSVVAEAVYQLQEFEDNLFGVERNNEKMLVGDDAVVAKREIKELISVINAAAGDLVMAHSVSENNNKMPIATSVQTMVSNLPLIVKDVRSLSRNYDDGLRALLSSTRNMWSADLETVNDAASKFADCSSKLLYSLTSTYNPQNEKIIMESAKLTANKVTELLDRTNECINDIQDEGVRDRIEEAGIVCADTARRFIKCAQIISSTLSAPCCRISFITAAKKLEKSFNDLIAVLPNDQALSEIHKELQNLLTDLQSNDYGNKQLLSEAREINQVKKDRGLVVSGNNEKETTKNNIQSNITVNVFKVVQHPILLKENTSNIFTSSSKTNLEDKQNDIQEERVFTNVDKSIIHTPTSVEFVDPTMPQKFDYNYQYLARSTSPKLLCKTAQDILDDLKTLSYQQKSPQIRNNHLAYKINEAAINIQLAEEKSKTDIYDVELKDSLQQAILNVHHAVNELKLTIPPLHENTQLSLMYDKPEKVQDLLDSIDKIAFTSDPEMKWEESKCLSNNLNDLYEIEESSKVNEYIKHFSESITKAAQALQLANNKAKDRPNDKQIQIEVKNSIEDLNDVSRDLRNFLLTCCKIDCASTSSLCVKPDIMQTIKSNYIKLTNATDPKTVSICVKLLLSSLNNLYEIQKSPHIRKDLEVHAQRLAEAKNDLKLATIRNKDKFDDGQLQENVIKAVTNVHNTAKNLKITIPALSTDIKTSILYIQPDTIKYLNNKIEEIIDTYKPEVVCANTLLFINEIKNINKIQTSSQTRRNLDYYIRKLTEAVQALRSAELKAKQKKNDVAVQNELPNIIYKIHNTMKEFQEDIPLLNEETKTLTVDEPNLDRIVFNDQFSNKPSVLDLNLSPESGNLIILSVENVKKSSQANETIKHARLLIMDLHNILKNESSDKCKNYVEKQITDLTISTVALEHAEKLSNENPKDLALKKGLRNAHKNLLNIVNELYKDMSDFCNRNKQDYIKVMEIPHTYAQTLQASIQAVIKAESPKCVVENAWQLHKNIKEIDKSTINEDIYKQLDDYDKKILHNIKSLDKAETMLKKKSNEKNQKIEVLDSISNIHKVCYDFYDKLIKSNSSLNRNCIKITPKLGQVLKSSADNIILFDEPDKVEEHALILVNNIKNVLKEEKSTEVYKNLQYFAEEISKAAKVLEVLNSKTRQNPDIESVKADKDSVVEQLHNIAKEFQNSIECPISPNSKINRIGPPVPVRKITPEWKHFSKASLDFINSEKDLSAKHELSAKQPTNYVVPLDLKEIDSKTLQKLYESINDILKENDKNSYFKQIENLLNTFKNTEQYLNKQNEGQGDKYCKLFTNNLLERIKEMKDAEHNLKIKPLDAHCISGYEKSKLNLKRVVEDLKYQLNSVNQLKTTTHEICITWFDALDLITNLDALLAENCPQTIKNHCITLTDNIQKQANKQQSIEARNILNGYINKLKSAVDGIKFTYKDKKEFETNNVETSFIKNIARELKHNIIGARELEKKTMHQQIDVDQFIHLLKNTDHNEQYDIDEFINTVVESIRNHGEVQMSQKKRVKFEKHGSELNHAYTAFCIARQNASENKDFQSKEEFENMSEKLIRIVYMIQNELNLSNTVNMNKNPVKITIILTDADLLINNIKSAIMQQNLSLIKSIIDDIQIQANNQKSDVAKDYLNSFSQRLLDAETELNTKEQIRHISQSTQDDKLQESKRKIMDILKEFQQDVLETLDENTKNKLPHSEVQHIVQFLMYSKSIPELLEGANTLIKNIEEMETKSVNNRIGRKNYAHILKSSIQALKIADSQGKHNPKDVKAEIAVRKAKATLTRIANQYLSDIEFVQIKESKEQNILSQIETKVIKRRIIDNLSHVNVSVLNLISKYSIQWFLLSLTEETKNITLWNLHPDGFKVNKAINDSTVVKQKLTQLFPTIYKDVSVLSEALLISTSLENEVSLIKNIVENVYCSLEKDFEFQDLYYNFVLMEEATSYIVNSLECANDADRITNLKLNVKELLHVLLAVKDNQIKLTEKILNTEMSWKLQKSCQQLQQTVLKHCFYTLILSTVLDTRESKHVIASSISDIEENSATIQEFLNQLPDKQICYEYRDEMLIQLKKLQRIITKTKDLINNDVHVQSSHVLDLVEGIVNDESHITAENVQKIVQNVNLLSEINKAQNANNSDEVAFSEITNKYIENIKDVTDKIKILEADLENYSKDGMKINPLKDLMKILHHLLINVVFQKEIYYLIDIHKLKVSLNFVNEDISATIKDAIKETNKSANKTETQNLNIILNKINEIDSLITKITSEIYFVDNAHTYIQYYKSLYEHILTSKERIQNVNLYEQLQVSSEKCVLSINGITRLTTRIQNKHNCITLNNTLDSIDILENYAVNISAEDKNYKGINNKENEIYRFYAYEALGGICEEVLRIRKCENIDEVCLKIIVHLCVFIYNNRLQNILEFGENLRVVNELKHIFSAIRMLLIQVFNYYIYEKNRDFSLDYLNRCVCVFVEKIYLDNKCDLAHNLNRIFNYISMANSNETNVNILDSKEKLRQNVNEFNNLISAIPEFLQTAEENKKIQSQITGLFLEIFELFSKLGSDGLDKLTRTINELLRCIDFVHHNQHNIIARRSLIQSCFRINNCINQMIVANVAATPKLQLQCEQTLRNVRMLRVTLHHDIKHPVNGCSYARSLNNIEEMRSKLDKFKVEDLRVLDNFDEVLEEDFKIMFNCVIYAGQCVYLLSISESEKSVAQNGFIDTHRWLHLANKVQALCSSLQYAVTEKDEICSYFIEHINALYDVTLRLYDEIKETNPSGNRDEWLKHIDDLAQEAQNFNQAIKEREIGKMDKPYVLSSASSFNKVVRELMFFIKKTTFLPSCTEVSPEVTKCCDAVTQSISDMITKYTAFVENFKTIFTSLNTQSINQSIASSRTDFISAFCSLKDDLRKSGEICNLMYDGQNDENTNGYLNAQLNLSKKWLLKPKLEKNKSLGQEGVKNLITVAETITKEFKDQDTDDVSQLVIDTKLMLDECCQTSDEDKCRSLLDKIIELKRVIEKSVVNQVVNTFNEEDLLSNVNVIIRYQADEATKTALLEKEITKFLNNMEQMMKTTRVVVAIRGKKEAFSQTLLGDSMKAELLAPKLIEEAKLSVEDPNNLVLKNKLTETCNDYYTSVTRVRDLCDKSVDPLDFVRSAGESMHKLSVKTKNNVEGHSLITNAKITRLANRVLLIGTSEIAKSSDPELDVALRAAQQKLQAALPSPDSSSKQLPDKEHITNEILRSAREVESALGGETIFKQNVDQDQPIFIAAQALHTCVSEWSARDNDIVSAARRAAVLMAKLSTYMAQDKKDASIRTSKEIVDASSEVTRLARKLSLECSDIRIRKNLQQVSEQITTISGQLKMLASVKATSNSSNTNENHEAMAMLEDNARNLMLSVENVVKAAAAASVKIDSERGVGRMRWVRTVSY